MSTTDTTRHSFQPGTPFSVQDTSPLELDAETFYHLGMLAVEIATEVARNIIAALRGEPLFGVATSPFQSTTPA